MLIKIKWHNIIVWLGASLELYINFPEKIINLKQTKLHVLNI